MQNGEGTCRFARFFSTISLPPRRSRPPRCSLNPRTNPLSLPSIPLVRCRRSSSGAAGACVDRRHVCFKLDPFCCPSPRPFIPLICCPDCGLLVKQYHFGTMKHDRWILYKCKRHGTGCNFWNWELGYVGYLVENDYLQGDAAVDALGWAEERREELQLKNEECAATCPGHEEMLMKSMNSMVELLTEAMLLLKFLVGMLAVVCMLLVQKNEE